MAALKGSVTAHRQFLTFTVQVEWAQEIHIRVFQSALNQKHTNCVSFESTEGTILGSSGSQAEHSKWVWNAPFQAGRSEASLHKKYVI